MNEILAAIYQRLDSLVTATVYDHVPQDLDDSAYPYVRIGAVDPQDNGTDTETGFLAEIQVYSYSRYRGFAQINQVADEVYGALHRWQMPNTASYGISSIRETVRSIMMLGDGLTRNAVQRYEIIFEPLP